MAPIAYFALVVGNDKTVHKEVETIFMTPALTLICKHDQMFYVLTAYRLAE